MAKFKEVQDRLISISSFSKLFNMMNYRLGYAVGPADIIHGMEMIQSFSSMGIPVLLQRGAIPALNKEFEDKHIAETIARLQKARDSAVRKLNSVEGMRISSPEGTNLLLPEISSFGMSSMDFCKYLLEEAGVACAPGIAYHAEGHIRISLGTHRIEEAIDRIVVAVSKLPRKVPKKILARAR
jgi:aspartate/methionine/tyrosine aminotransferase